MEQALNFLETAGAFAASIFALYHLRNCISWINVIKEKEKEIHAPNFKRTMYASIIVCLYALFFMYYSLVCEKAIAKQKQIIESYERRIKND